VAYPSSSRSSERVHAAVRFFNVSGRAGSGAGPGVLESLECCALAQTKLSAAAMCRHDLIHGKSRSRQSRLMVLLWLLCAGVSRRRIQTSWLLFQKGLTGQPFRPCSLSWVSTWLSHSWSTWTRERVSITCHHLSATITCSSSLACFVTVMKRQMGRGQLDVA
jgi:hypothetical protein